LRYACVLRLFALFVVCIHAFTFALVGLRSVDYILPRCVTTRCVPFATVYPDVPRCLITDLRYLRLRCPVVTTAFVPFFAVGLPIRFTFVPRFYVVGCVYYVHTVLIHVVLPLHYGYAHAFRLDSWLVFFSTVVLDIFVDFTFPRFTFTTLPAVYLHGLRHFSSTFAVLDSAARSCRVWFAVTVRTHTRLRCLRCVCVPGLPFRTRVCRFNATHWFMVCYFPFSHVRSVGCGFRTLRSVLRLLWFVYTFSFVYDSHGSFTVQLRLHCVLLRLRHCCIHTQLRLHSHRVCLALRCCYVVPVFTFIPV